MYIVMLASECAPVAKVGGLGEVVLGLSHALEQRGHALEIILPYYACMRHEQIQNLQLAWADLIVPWGHGSVQCTVFHGLILGRSCFFIDPHSAENFFQRSAYYGFPDDHLRFTFFSKAALEFLRVSGKRPDVIHTHDWQTAIVPILLYEIYRYQDLEQQRVCHTVHNFKHQGIVGNEVLSATRLDRPAYYHHEERMQDADHPGALNLTKGAINYANWVTTVSPRYAWEARFTDQGHSLGHTLYRHRDKFKGILNGIDYSLWNPRTDKLLASCYDAEHLDAKYANKKALRDRLGLPDDFKPLLAYIGRLDPQKGVHLIRHALFYALERGAQFVLLGTSPDPLIEEEFAQTKREFSSRSDVHLELSFNEELAHLIYAGADMVVTPSLFEPCGLTQMIALRYGAVPIVRSVGGLIDTVFDRDHGDCAAEKRNGYVFHEPDYQGVESALYRAIGLWYSFPGEWRQLMRNGMRCNYSWERPTENYLSIYEIIRHKL